MDGENGTSVGKECQWIIEPPIGFVVRLRIRRIGLGLGDTFSVSDDWDDGEEEEDNLFVFTGGLHNVTNATNGTLVHGLHVNRPVRIDLKTTGSANGTGIAVEYEFVPRQWFMQQQGNATLLQFALAVLEAQGANMPALGWNAVAESRHAPISAPPGHLHLGATTSLEQCFLCCFLGGAWDPGAEHRQRELASLLDSAPVPEEWEARPSEAAYVGTTIRAPTTEVAAHEIPPLVAYMGHGPSHFVRTAYVSAYPPGSVRAPMGHPLGEVPDFDVEIGDDIPEREMVGWGMRSVRTQEGGSFEDSSDAGWERGWGYGERAGKGTHWRNGDGASAAWFPAWQILVPEEAVLDDVERWRFDLDSADLPLFSFVDADRRIVMSNEMALALPCGVAINNTCGVSCGIVGTGLNVMQCLRNVEVTPCLQPVVDECSNECGFTGTKACLDTLKPLSLRVTAMNRTQSTANFEISVGMQIDLNDGLTRSNDISGLGIVGVVARDGGGGGWVHPSTSGAVSSPIDNSMLLSFHDPAQDGFYETEIDGTIELVFLSRDDILVLQATPLDIPFPRECYKGPDKCKFRTPIDDVTRAGTWFNASFIPWWDSDEDKRVGWNELGNILNRNFEVLSLVFLSDLGVCRERIQSAACITALLDLQARIMTDFGSIATVTTPGASPTPCKGLSFAVASTQCLLTITDLEELKATLEATRRRTLQSIGARPRFDMAKIRRLQSAGGFEFASPDPTLERVYNHNTNTLRFSSMFEATGEYIRLGSSRHLNISVCNELELVRCYDNVTASGSHPASDNDGLMTIASGWSQHVKVLEESWNEGLCNITMCEWSADFDVKTLSHVFFDGIIKERVPFRFDGGSMGNGTTHLVIEGKRAGKLGRQREELPQVDANHPHSAKNTRVITLPDATGKVVGTGNLDDIRQLPGLRTRRPSPYRYDNSSVHVLDDGRTIEGSRYWYKRMLGGDADGVCGTFDDGTPIPCPSVKVQYDALEASGSVGDEVLVYTGETELQGTQLSRTPASMTPDPRLDCAPLRSRCEDASLEDLETYTFTFIPKGISLCVASDKRIYDDQPIACDVEDPTSCLASIVETACTKFPVWGPELDRTQFVERWTSLSEYRAEGIYPSAWQLPFDPRVSRTLVDNCMEAEELLESPSLSFLHIYYGTDRGVELLESLERRLEAAGAGRRRNETSLGWYALKYLDLQGVASIEVGSTPVQVLRVAEALETEGNGAELQVWASSTLETCFACCLRSRDTEQNLRTQVPAGSEECVWLNISGTGNPQNAVAEGAYRLMDAVTSFGRPVWKQDPGELYLHFLPSACTSTPDCGPGADPHLRNMGPAWVVGPAIGKDIVVLRATPPANEGWLNGTYYTAADGVDLLTNSTRGFAWYHPALLAEAMPNSTTWFEHYSPDLSDFNENTTLFGVRWFLPSPNISMFCSDMPLYRYATTAIIFDDPQDFRKLSFPDVDGTVISKGNLDMITTVGVQASPLLGRSREVEEGHSPTTRVKFGVGWQSVTVDGGNDLLSLAISSRLLSYCAVRRTECEYSHPPPLKIDQQSSTCYPLAPEAIECPWPGGTPILGEEYGVDGLILTEEAEPEESEECVAFFPAHEYYFGTATFASLGADTQCFGDGVGGFLSVTSPTSELTYEASPPYWGLGSPFTACPLTVDYLGENMDTPTELCKAYMREGCQDACLRDRSCIGARFFYESYRCQKIYNCDTTVPKFALDTWDDLIKTGGGWTPSRWTEREAENGVDAFEIAVGSTVVLGDMPDRTWVVAGRDVVSEPCPLHISIPDSDAFSTAGCDAFRAASYPLRVTWNMTSTHRYRLCLEGGSRLASDGLGDTVPAVPSRTTVNISQGTPLPHRISVDRFGALAGAHTVQIGNEVFAVEDADASISSLLLGVPLSNQSGRAVIAFEYFAGSDVRPVLGGFFNSSRSIDIRVPHGVYSLENITQFLNREIESRLGVGPWRLSFQIQEPGKGLCGEIGAGTSHDVMEFHCAPGSRFLSLEGSVARSAYGSDDDNVQVLERSTILELLGLASPERAYAFTTARRAPIPSSTVHHRILPGAGYISSGYGHFSGYGRGGQPGWDGYVPPEFTLDLEPYTIWCHDDFGYQCVSEDCGCDTAPVLTVGRVLGSTKTQRGHTPQSNTLTIPSNGDGIIVSTGNLEDVTVESAAMTGLRVDALKEHDQGIAAKIGGWLQFSACASLFGEAECDLITPEDASIRLGPSARLAIRSYYRTSFWVALYNASSELHAAAVVNDTVTAWPLLAAEPWSINRTFSASQDILGVQSAADACHAYCDDLTVRQRREAEAATQFLTDALVRMPASVWRTSRDTGSYCAAVQCSVGGAIFSVQQFADPMASCVESSFCFGNPAACTCSVQQRCSQLWNGARPPNLARADPWTYADSWELCVRSISLERKITEFCDCEGYNYTDPNAEPRCCVDLELLNRQEILLEKAVDAEESFAFFKGYDFMTGWELIQWNETLQVCNCIELEGAVDDIMNGEDAVLKHVCAVGDERYASPVCESTSTNLSIGANGSETTTYLAVERPTNTQTQYLSVPSADGVVLTTGKLDAITRDAGSMTSIHVREHSQFRDQVSVGTVGLQAGSQGSRHNANGTVIFGDVSSAFCQGTQVSDTAHVCLEPDLHLSLQQSMVSLIGETASAHVSIAPLKVGNWTIDFPTWDDNLCVGEARSGCESRSNGLASFSGKVITTGNLEDVTALSPNLVDTAGDTILEGEVRLGASQACSSDGFSLYGATYSRYGWRAHTATECVEVQEQVDWEDSTRVQTLSVRQCKQLCEDEPSCEVLVVQIDVDRYPTNDLAKCLLIAFPERKCTMTSNPLQDTYLLQRKAPSPWLETIADQQFFDALCTERVNATHVPGVPIHLDGYLQGDITWRSSAPMTWKAYERSSCDSFEGFELLDTESTLLENITVEECRSRCESSADCGVVTYQAARDVQIYVEIENPHCMPNLSAQIMMPGANETNLTMANETNATMLNGTADNRNSTVVECNSTMWVWRTVTAPPRCALGPLASARRVLSNRTTVPGVCTIVANNSTDTFVFSRNEHVALRFMQPTGERELVVTDSTGVIITTGNTYDIDRNVGVSGQDSWLVSHPQRVDALASADLSEAVMFGGARSDFSGVRKGVLIRNCGQVPLTCDVYVSDGVTEDELQQEIATHVLARSMTVNRLIRGSGDGFNDRKTTIDFAIPGSRTSGECFGDCKGALTCERGTTSCTSDCPGYMFDRPGVDMTLECTTSGSRGEVCGCANGEAFGQFGTSACVMRNTSHPDHGRYCATRSASGESLFLFDCCYDPEHCGECVTFPPEKPVGRNNRITFPQATGVVVTTGNIDDVVLRNIQLNGLDLKGFVDIGVGYPADSLEPTFGAPDGYRFDVNQDQVRAHIDLHPVSTRVLGGLRMVAGFGSPNKLYGTGTQDQIPGTAESSKYTHLFTVKPTALEEPLPQHAERYCVDSVAFEERVDADSQQQSEERDLMARCEYKREILLPPTSGTVLTVENLDNVPAVAIPLESLIMASLNSSFIVEGNLTFGKVVNYTTDPFNNGGYRLDNKDRIKQSVAKLYNQFDGDVGLTMQSASSSIPLRPSTQGLADLPNYGENVVGESPYSEPPFSGPHPFGGPSPAQVISDFARDGRIGDEEDRSFALDFVRISMPQGGGVDTAARAYLRGGAPRLPVSVQDARSVPSEPNQLSDHYAYRSGQPVLQQRSITMPSAADSYAPAVDGSPREANQALHGSTPINVTWCYQTLAGLPAVDPSNNVPGVRTLSMFMSFMVEKGFLVPTLLSGAVGDMGAITPNATEANIQTLAAFDSDLSTWMNMAEPCIIELDLGDGNEAEVSFIRYAAGPGFESEVVGGKFQGSMDNSSFVDMVEIVDLPLGPVYITAINYQQGKFRHLRYVGPAGNSGCHIAEIEFHSGERVIELTELQHGRVSWRVDEEVLFRRENVEAAMLVKCAAHGMIPSMLDNSVQEIILPEAQGQIITSGNLADISLETGSFTSMTVAGDLEVDGWVTLGEPDGNALLTVNSRLDSSSYFAFGGPTVEVGALTSLLTNSMPEDKITFMPDASGTLVLGELPSVMDDVMVMEEGGLDLEWNTEVRARLQLGVVNQPESPGSVEINAVLGSTRPLSFDGTFVDDAEHITLGVVDPSKDTILTLPDVTGTVVTSATLPRVFDNVTAVEGQLNGNVFFEDADVQVGVPGGYDGMSIHANILGLDALQFDGTARKDGRTLTLSALDPDSDSELMLPDTTGTVVTTANFPRKFDTLRSLDELRVKGAASHTGELVTVGRAGGQSRLSIQANIGGRAPLLFDGGLRGADLEARRTSFLMPDSSRDNTITFPDVSGTVVTTSNQPTRIVTEGRYSVDAVSVTVAADTLLLGLGVLDGVEGGSFVFSDLLAKEFDHRPDRPNQFSTHCSGGAVFVTGETPKGKAMGATLAPKASAWSYVSDRHAKELNAEVNGTDVLEALKQVEVSRWRYDAAGGAGAEHIGPMAQAVHRAFGLGGSAERIGMSDADGIALGAVQGLHARVEALRAELAARARELARQEEVLAAQAAQMAAREARLQAQAARLQQLWVAARARTVA